MIEIGHLATMQWLAGETLGPGIHVYAIWHAPPNGSCTLSRTMHPDTPQKLLRNVSRDVTKGSRCQPGLQTPLIPIWSSVCSMRQIKMVCFIWSVCVYFAWSCLSVFCFVIVHCMILLSQAFKVFCVYVVDEPVLGLRLKFSSYAKSGTFTLMLNVSMLMNVHCPN